MDSLSVKAKSHYCFSDAANLCMLKNYCLLVIWVHSVEAVAVYLVTD